jgi:hypothetical protein
LRFSNADKRKAATLALKDSKLKKSDNQIAALIGVSQPFVSKLRKELEAKPITVITPAGDDGVPAKDAAPLSKPAVGFDRIVAKFRALLSSVPESERAAFSDQVVAILADRSESTAAE